MVELWTEKYRPKTLEDIVLPEQEKDNIRRAIQEKNIPHYLFIGPPGVGKTSLANVIINELNAEALRINASEERGIDVIRDKVMRFVGIITEKPKIVFLDEADSLTAGAQASLRNVMETYADNCRFILTGNYDKFIEPIKDRCEVVRFKQLSKQDALDILYRIVANERINVSNPDDIQRIVDTFYPSIRKMILTLQKYSYKIGDVGYELRLPDTLTTEDNKDYDTLFTLFQNGELAKIRQLISEQGVNDFIPIYRHFFRKFVDELNDELSAIIVTEYMFRDTFVADKELNFYGCLLALKNKAYPFAVGGNIQSNTNSVSYQQTVQPSNNQLQHRTNASDNNIKNKPVDDNNQLPTQSQSKVVSGTIPSPPPIKNNGIPKPPVPQSKLPLPGKQLPQKVNNPPSNNVPQKKPTSQISNNPKLQKLNALIKKKHNQSQKVDNNTTQSNQVNNTNNNDFIDSVNRIHDELEQ